MPSPLHHEGVSCDGCLTPNFSGNRYKCLRCYDFDLCHACFLSNRFRMDDSGGGGQTHSADHPVQCILSHRDFETVYEGDSTKNYDLCKVVVLSCPYCGLSGFNQRVFYEHLSRIHPEAPSPGLEVNCPLCCGLPDFDGARISDMKTHWNTHHLNELSGGVAATMRGTLDGGRAGRRPVLARRTARQPAGNHSAVAGAATLAAQFGLPWTDSAEVEELMRVATVRGAAGGLPSVHLASHFPQLVAPLNAGSAIDRAPSQMGSAWASSSSLLPLRVGASSTKAAADAVARGLARAASTPAQLSLVASVKTTPIYLPAAEEAEASGDGSKESVTAEDEHSNSVSSEEYASAEEPPEMGDRSDSEFSFSEEIPMEGTSKAEEEGKEEMDEERDKSPPDTDDDVDLSVDNLRPLSFSKLLERECEPAERATIETLLSQWDDDEEPVEPKTLRSAEPQQAWLTVEFDTSGMSFPRRDYWKDSRFLRHKKMRRELSVASKKEEVLARADLATALLRAASGVSLPTSTREFDSSRKAIEALLREMRLSEKKSETADLVGDMEEREEKLLPEVEETKEVELPPSQGVVESDAEDEEDDEVEDAAGGGLRWFDDDVSEAAVESPAASL